jgi:hypothetical protein
VGAAGEGGQPATDGATGVGSPEGRTVEERLADVYQGRTILHWRYLLVGLAILAGWWLLFGPFSTFLAAMGLFALASGLGPTVTAAAGRRWPTTEAVVLESRVFTMRELRDSFDGLDRTGSASGGYAPFIRYEYSVDGETHVNVRVSPFDGRIPRRRFAERITESYSERTHVPIRYDPTDPSRSFLRTWTWSTRLLFFLAGSALFLVPAIWLAVDAPLPVDIPGIALVIAFGSLFVILGLYLFVNALRTYRWPTTTGVVRGQDVSSSSSSEGSTSYSPKLRYEYEVDGDTYVSSRIAVGSGPSFNSRSGAREWLEDYPVDSEVTVRYNPGRPDRSVLQPGGVLGGLLVLLISGGMLAVFLLLETGNEQLLARFVERLPLDRLPF